MSATAGLAAVPGVTAVVLFDERGARLEGSATDRPSDDPALDRAAHALADAMAAMAHGAGVASGLFARTSEGWMLLRRVASYTLLVTGRGTPRAAMLEVALAMLAARLQPARAHGRRVAAATIPMTPERGPAVGLPTMKALLGLLEDALGATARDALRDEVNALGASPHTLTRDAWPTLVDRLARRIGAVAEQQAFREDALSLLTAAR